MTASSVQPAADQGKSWYVVVTQAHQERHARYQLEQQGFRVYLPMVPPPARARARNGIAPAPRPLIPRYLFIEMDLDQDRWRAVYSTYGVTEVITRGTGETARPCPIPASFIEATKSREVNGLVVLQRPRNDNETAPKSAARFKRGQRLRLAGQTADYDVIFDEMVDGDRAAVVFTLLGRDSRQIIALPSED
ncbi:transcription termination/antitermination NusG family protein [Brevundimonas faecalis]|uniref:transcription termination/antitermination NusG family protein n=1 Tax=Brevundimonas faecalis TaxID=947378 RepID=UPI00339804EE